MEQLITVTLFGKPYDFKVDSEVEQAQEVADFLIQEVSKIETRQPHRPNEVAKLAILISAALNIANEHIQLKKDHAALLQGMTEKSASLMRVLDAHMQQN